MKGVIVKNKKYYSIILSEKGQYIKSKNPKNKTLGEEIQIEEISNIQIYSNMLIKPAVAAVVVLLLMYSTILYFTPYAYYTMDVNPSVELTVNRFDYIIEAHGINEDGQKVLENINIRNKKLDKSIEEIYESTKEAGYVDEEASQILLTVFSDDEKYIKTAKTVLDNTATKIKEKAENEGVDISVQTAQKVRIEEARELNISPGKLNLIEKIEDEYGIELDEQELKDFKVQDIMAYRLEAKDEEKAKNKDNNGKAFRKEKDNNNIDNRGKSDVAPGKNKDEEKNNENEAEIDDNKDNNIDNRGKSDVAPGKNKDEEKNNENEAEIDDNKDNNIDNRGKSDVAPGKNKDEEKNNENEAEIDDDKDNNIDNKGKSDVAPGKNKDEEKNNENEAEIDDNKENNIENRGKSDVAPGKSKDDKGKKE